MGVTRIVYPIRWIGHALCVTQPRTIEEQNVKEQALKRLLFLCGFAWELDPDARLVDDDDRDRQAQRKPAQSEVLHVCLLPPPGGFASIF
jgi:hypothetical protein